MSAEAMNLHGSPRSLEALRARHGTAYKWLVLLTLSFGMMASMLSATIFNVAAPSLMRGFALSQDTVQWAVTAYMAAMTIAMLPVAWLADRFGMRKVFLAAVGLLAIGSLGGALSWRFDLVVSMRICQGIAAGILQPLATLVVIRHFPQELRGKALGALSFGIVLAPAVAPVIGGMLVDHYGWRAIFLLTLPPAMVAIALALRLLPVREKAITTHAFDWLGLSWLALAIVSLLQTLSGLKAHPHWLASLGWLLLTMAALLAFIRHARRVHAPLFHFELFATRSFTMGCVVSFAYGLGLFGSTYLIPVFLQTAARFSATHAGVALLPGGIALALMMPVAGHVTDRAHPHLQIALGLLLFAASFFWLAWLAGHPSLAEFMVAVVIGRIGLALILPSLNLGSLRELAAHQVGQATGLVSCLRQIGGAMGISLGAVFIEWRAPMPQVGDARAFGEAFIGIAVVFLLATLAASGMRGAKKET